jgi:hypothetical protein
VNTDLKRWLLVVQPWARWWRRTHPRCMRELDLFGCDLTDVGLGPLVDALRGSTHLRELVLHENGITDAFKRERLLPAVRASPWLETTAPPWSCEAGTSVGLRRAHEQHGSRQLLA